MDFSYRQANSYDYNRDGLVSQRELPRSPAASRALDKNFDSRVSTWELADGLRFDRVKIRGGELKASWESDYRPYRPEPRYYDYPRYDYDYPRHRTTEGEDIVGGAIVGGVLGAVAGSLFGGKDGAAAGAIIGGTLGAVSGVR